MRKSRRAWVNAITLRLERPWKRPAMDPNAIRLSGHRTSGELSSRLFRSILSTANSAASSRCWQSPTTGVSQAIGYTDANNCRPVRCAAGRLRTNSHGIEAVVRITASSGSRSGCQEPGPLERRTSGSRAGCRQRCIGAHAGVPTVARRCPTRCNERLHTSSVAGNRGLSPVSLSPVSPPFFKETL